MHQDQRLQKICGTLTNNDYEIHLVGVRKRETVFSASEFECHSIPVLFNEGPLFYLEINLRFIFFLLFRKLDAVVSNDLDTLLAGKLISKLRSKKLFIDLHEYFTEVPELEDKAFKKRLWNTVGNLCISKRSVCYTVNESLSDIFSRKYDTPFQAVYNFPKQSSIQDVDSKSSTLKLVYVGLVNKGRGIKEAIAAVSTLDGVSLTIYGNGDEYEEIKEMVADKNLENKIDLKGFQDFEAVRKELPTYNLGLNLLDGESKNYYYSSANKFFDYTMAGIPTLNMNFPEYQKFNKQHQTSLLIDTCSIETIKQAIQSIQKQPESLDILRTNCFEAKKQWHWESQEKTLLALYSTLKE